MNTAGVLPRIDGLFSPAGRAARVTGCASGIGAAIAAASATPFCAPDIVVHAAGMNRRQPWAQTDDGDGDEQIDVMLAAPFFLSRALRPAVAGRGWGRIIAIATLQSRRAFSDSLPGFFPTALTGAVFDDAARVQAIRLQTACRRTGALADLHGAAVFRASPASGSVPGQTPYVDGGFSAR